MLLAVHATRNVLEKITLPLAEPENARVKAHIRPVAPNHAAVRE